MHVNSAILYCFPLPVQENEDVSSLYYYPWNAKKYYGGKIIGLRVRQFGFRSSSVIGCVTLGKSFKSFEILVSKSRKRKNNTYLLGLL